MPHSLSTVTAAILAGGLGTRLQSVISDRPKVLAPVAGRPWLLYLLDQLASAGVEEVVLLTGYRADQVRAVIGETYRGMRLCYSVEETPLGTAGAVRQALSSLRSPVVLLLNGDSYCEVDLRAFRRFHEEHRADISLVLTRVSDSGRFGQVVVAEDGRLIEFAEKGGAAGTGWINAGIYLIARQIIEELPPARPISLERDVFPHQVRTKRMFGFQGGGRFIDIGTPQSYTDAALFFQQGGQATL